MELLAKIKTAADLEALKQTLKTNKELRKSFEETGDATAALDRQIGELEAALGSEKAKAIESIGALEKHARALRDNGQSASLVENKILKLRKQFGVKGASFLGNVRNELVGLVNDIPGVGRLVTSLTNIFGASRTAVLGWAAAIVTAIAAIAKGIKAFSQKKIAVDALNQSLANAGVFSKDMSASFQQLATELQRTTGIADSQWLATITKLVQFGSRPESLGVDIEAVKNLAGLYGGDLTRAAEAYGKALQGQFDSLRENGIILDAHLSKTEKLAQLQRILAERGTGLLEARMQDLSGTMAGVGNEISDLLSKLGSWASNNRLVRGSLETVGNALEYWNDKIESTIPAIEGLRNAQRNTTRDMDASVASVTAYGDRLDESITKKAEKAAAALSKVTDEITRQQSEQDRVADAKLALDIAQVKARTDLSDPQKLAIEQRLRANAAKEKYERAQAAGKARQKANDELATTAEGAARRTGGQAELLERGADLTRRRENAETIRDSLAQQIEADRAELERLRNASAPERFLNPLTNSPLAVYRNAWARHDYEADQERIPVLENLLRQRLNLLPGRNAGVEAARRAESEFDRAAPEFAGMSAAALSARAAQTRQAATAQSADARAARQRATDENAAIDSELATQSQVRSLTTRREAIENRGALTDAVLADDRAGPRTRTDELNRSLQESRRRDAESQAALLQAAALMEQNAASQADVSTGLLAGQQRIQRELDDLRMQVRRRR